MSGQEIRIASEAIRYIEEHLGEKLELNSIAAALHYSGFHLHRSFTRAVGLTIHSYTGRRRLTKAAKALACSGKPILEIALEHGYGSQQAFTEAFRSMYKTTPARFRKEETFYPLQLELRLKEEHAWPDLSAKEIRFASADDIRAWIELVGSAVDGYPRLNEAEYLENLQRSIRSREAMILRAKDMAIGAMIFSASTGSIGFLAVHPQYRRLGITKLFLDKLQKELLPGRKLSITTYRAGDRADTGYRAEYRRLGFTAQELLVEYGYPTQRFVLPPNQKEENHYERNRKKSAGTEF